MHNSLRSKGKAVLQPELQQKRSNKNNSRVPVPDIIINNIVDMDPPPAVQQRAYDNLSPNIQMIFANMTIEVDGDDDLVWFNPLVDAVENNNKEQWTAAIRSIPVIKKNNLRTQLTAMNALLYAPATADAPPPAKVTQGLPGFVPNASMASLFSALTNARGMYGNVIFEILYDLVRQNDLNSVAICIRTLLAPRFKGAAKLPAAKAIELASFGWIFEIKNYTPKEAGPIMKILINGHDGHPTAQSKKFHAQHHRPHHQPRARGSAQVCLRDRA